MALRLTLVKVEEEGEKEQGFFPETIKHKLSIRKDKFLKNAKKFNALEKWLSALFSCLKLFWCLFSYAATPKQQTHSQVCSKLLLRSHFHSWPFFCHLTLFLHILSVDFHTSAPLQTRYGDSLPCWNNCGSLATPYNKHLVRNTSLASAWKTFQLFATKVRVPFSATVPPAPLLPCQHRHLHWHSFQWQWATRNTCPCFQANNVTITKNIQISPKHSCM